MVRVGPLLSQWLWKFFALNPSRLPRNISLSSLKFLIKLYKNIKSLILFSNMIVELLKCYETYCFHNYINSIFPCTAVSYSVIIFIFSVFFSFKLVKVFMTYFCSSIRFFKVCISSLFFTSPSSSYFTFSYSSLNISFKFFISY